MAMVVLAAAIPATAAAWSVSLSTSATDVEVGTYVTLTATANQTVTNSGYYIDIFDQTTGTPIDYCAYGTTCQVSVSQSEASSHTYIAYVDGDPVVEYPPCCIQATSNTVNVTWHAKATAAMDVEFQANGTLPTFPCPTGCDATFAGSGSGAGNAHAVIGTNEYDATFALPSGSVSGTAAYTEPGPPFCPAVGSASGTVVLSGSTTGVVTRTSTPSVTGTVTGVTFRLNYSYQRAGPGTVVTITGGTATIEFTFPGAGPSYFVSNVTGAGPGAFEVDPTLTTSRCQSPGSLPFTVAGDVALVLT